MTATTVNMTKLADPKHPTSIYALACRHGELIACGRSYDKPSLITGDIHEIVMHARPPSRGLYDAHLGEETIWIVGDYGYVARSEDGGQSWEELASKCKKACLRAVTEDEEGNIWIGGADGALAVSKKGSGNFRPVKGFEASITHMTPSPLGILIVTSKPGGLQILKSGNLEKTSLDVDVYLVDVVYTPAGTLIVCGHNGAIYRSTDQGKSFDRVNAGHEDTNFETIEVFTDGRVVIGARDGKVLFSHDDGQTFVQVEHNLTTSIWASIAYEDGVIMVGDYATMIGLDIARKPRRYPPHHFQPGVDRQRLEASLPEFWRSPVLSTASQSWEPEERPTRVVNELYLSPTFMAWLVPRHGGLQDQIRPLPTKDEAWGELQRAVWHASAMIREERGSSPVWDYIASTDLAWRALGERLMSSTPADMTRADFGELIRQATKQSGRSELPLMMSRENNAKIVDYMVIVLGLEETIKLCFDTIYELAYSHTGLFERLRELTSQLDAEAHTDIQNLIYECYRAKCVELAHTESYVGRSRAGDLRWAATYMLPFEMGEPTEQQRRVHREALDQYLRKFGDLGTHAAGLASGDLDTFKAYLDVNNGFATQFCFPGSRLYLASILEREGGKACAPLFRTLRPTSPWTRDERYNLFVCRILAHIQDELAWEELLSRYRNEETRPWGEAGLDLAADLDPERLFSMLEAEGEAELRDRIEERLALRQSASSAHTIVAHHSTADLIAHPYSKTPPAPPHAPSTISPSFAPEPELRFSEDEREVVMDAKLSSKAEFEGTPLYACSDEQLERFVEFYERWRHPISMEQLNVIPRKYHARLIANGFHLDRWDIDYRLNQLLLKYGTDYIDILLWGIEHHENDDLRINALTHALPVADARIATHMIALFAMKKHKALAAKWMRRHPEHAVAGSLQMLCEEPDHTEAIRALLYLERFGHEELIAAYATKADREELIEAILARDPLTPKLRKKIKFPAYANPKALPPLVTIKASAEATQAEVEEYLYRFAFSNEEEPHPALLRARKIYTSESRAAFVWALFQAWLDDGAPAKQQWCLQALGFWGDDQTVHDLAALAKKWPGEGAGKRAQWALAALANTGLESALIHINLLSEKSRFPAFKATAAEFIEQIAQQQDLTREELSDRLAPTLDLEDEGSEILDFGPRQFTVRFDEGLVPFVVDGSNKRLKKLPKANASDDPALAKEAHKRFKTLKKEAKLSASLHTMRFEMIMASQRAIPAHVFSKFFVQHPWMTHLTQRLVWMTNPRDGEGGRRTFRVSVEQALVDMDEEELSLEGIESVCIAHPVHLSEREREQWLEIFADYELVQPFEQLGREIFSLDEAQKKATEIAPPNQGKEAHFRKILALEKRRWSRHEDIGIDGMTRPVEHGTHVMLRIDEGWFPYMEADDIELQKIDVLTLDAPDGVTFGSLDPAMISEILRDTVLLTR